MLIITHADFRCAAETLAAHRRAYDGITVLVADVEDVYDEFSYGRKSPDGIRNCVAAAVHDWAKPPAGVLLMGDASPDPKGRFAGAAIDFIPTYFFDADRGYSACDAMFAAVLEDGETPAVGLGRISCMTAAEADAIVQKIMSYDLSAPEGEWRKKVLLAADDTDYMSELNDYAAVSDLLSSFVPLDWTQLKVYLSGDPTLIHNAIRTAYENGAAIINFSGHGSRTIWADEDIFNVTDVTGGPAQPRQAFFIVSNCLTGAFDYPFSRCLD
jgi:lactate dehydrogenase-like 2-hydroxyacid dehydrogenase